MSGRTSGRNRVVSEVGQAGEVDAQHGNGGKTFSTVHDQPAQSSKSPGRDYSGVNVTTLKTVCANADCLCRTHNRAERFLKICFIITA